MGLYINNQEHPDVYKNKGQMKEPNQSYARQDFLTELIKEQLAANESLKKSLAEIKSRAMAQEKWHSAQWRQVDSQLNELWKSSLDQQNKDEEIIQSLQSINAENVNLQTSLKEESHLKQEMIDKVHQLGETLQDITSRLEQQEKANQQLSQQLNEQLALQKESVEKMNEQGAFQEDVLKRLDNQEALTEKISRQLNHIRSILFERTNYLATKIEDGYKVTSSYIYKLMTGSDAPLTFFMMNQREEDSTKQPEQQ